MRNHFQPVTLRVRSGHRAVSIKSIPLPVVGLRAEAVVGVAAAGLAAVMWTATAPRYLHPIHPVAPSLFPVFIYTALAGLAVLSTPMSRRLRACVWAPVFTHVILVAFAGYSFYQHGHWPWHSFPDPKYLHAPFFYGAAVLSVLATVFLVPAGAAALFCAVIKLRRNDWLQKAPGILQGVVVYALGAWLWLFEAQDRRLFSWLAD